jgi:indole-3-acetate monooxygenase
MISFPPPDTSAADLPELLRPAIEKYRDEADRMSCLPPELVGQLRSSGVFRLNAPGELGGFELPLTSHLDVLERLGRIDGPTAWVVWNANLGFVGAMLPESAVDRIWAAGADPIFANSGSPGRLTAEGDGYRLSGTWKIVSGSSLAEWFGLIAIVYRGDDPVMTEAGPEVRFCFVPRSAVTVEDTWHVRAMRGSNSNTVVVDDAPVPADMMLTIEATPRIDRPLYRVPLVHQVYPGGVAVLIGMAQAAIDEVVSHARAKIGMDGAPLAQTARLQSALGRATAQLGAARAMLMATAGQLDQAARDARPATDAERGAFRGAIAHAAETSRAVITAMYEAGSSAPLYESSRLGQIFADGHAAAQHANFSPAHYELAGRTLLGLPPAALFV